MADDVQPGDAGENAVCVSVPGTDADEITGYREASGEGATVIQPVGPAAWSPLYGTLKDRYGIARVLDVAAPSGT